MEDLNLKAIVESIPETIAIIDSQFRLEYINPAGELLLNITLPEVQGKIIEDLQLNPEMLISWKKSLIESKNFSKKMEFNLNLKIANIDKILHFFINPLTDPDDIEKTKFFTFIQDETENNSNIERWKMVFRESPIGIAIFNNDGSLLDANNSLFSILKMESIQNLSWLNLFTSLLISPENCERIKENKQLHLQSKINLNDISESTPDSEDQPDEIDLDLIITPFRNFPKKNNYGYFIHAQDITEKSWAIEAVFRSEQQYRAIFENASDAIVIHNMYGEIFEMNSRIKVLFGYEYPEFLKKCIWDIEAPKYPEKVKLRYNELIEQGEINYETFFSSKQGQKIPVEVHSRIIDYNNKPCIISVIRDITVRKRYEDSLLSSIKEKEVLLKEVHHRVKNNMQIIISLIKLQSHSIQDITVKGIMFELEQRIKTMALVHDKLYRSHDFTSVRAKEYIEKLVKDLIISSTLENEISLKFSLEDISFDLNTSIPYGLIINEVVTNALKYAFPKDYPGIRSEKNTLSLNLKKSEENIIELIIGDNGVGFTPTANPESSTTLGLQLIESLTNQLDGKYEVIHDDGTKYIFRFPDKSR